MECRTFNLQIKATTQLTAQDDQKYEKFDRIQIQGMKYAEKRCRRLKMDEVPWTQGGNRSVDAG